MKAQCRLVRDPAELDAALSGEWDLAISGYHLPGMDFRTALHRIQTKHPDLPIILLRQLNGVRSRLVTFS